MPTQMPTQRPMHEHTCIPGNGKHSNSNIAINRRFAIAKACAVSHT